MSAFETIRDTGELYAERPYVVLPSYEHPDDLAKQVDVSVMVVSDTVYTNSRQLGSFLQAYGVHVQDHVAARSVIENAYASQRQVWGFSGFATAGYEYHAEAAGMEKVYDTLLAEPKMTPSLVVDGGCSSGVLGLNAALAFDVGIETIGVIPRKGLAATSPRTHMLVWGDGYRERQIVVGTVPDVLVCIGGGEGTEDEARRAITCGSAVLMLALKDYGPASLPATYEQVPVLRDAEAAGRLLICRELAAVPEMVAAAFDAGTASDRLPRRAALDRMLR